ncbi:MAG: hypothetical protein K2X03_03040 [Bryobacteraceae bacterium]|nr:hypothetical protein [Bryobacteraceae bacterium]
MWLLTVGVALGAGWESVQRVAPGHKVEVSGKTETVRGTFVSASDTALVVRTKAGEQSIDRAGIRLVRIADPSKRVRNGLITTAIGLGAGLAIGYAVCPYCANEGSPGKYTGPGAAAGAGIGAAAGFLPMPFTTIYRSR